MPLNLNRIAYQIRSMPSDLAEYKANSAKEISAALDALNSYAINPIVLTEHINLALEMAANLDLSFICAVPTPESITLSYPLPACPERVTVTAGDGSQIFPDHHAIALYYCINVGCIAYRHGSGKTPEIYNPDPILCYRLEEVLDKRGDIIPTSEVRVRRDLGEIQALADLGTRYTQNSESVIALADGPLRLRVADLPFPRQKPCQAQYQAMLARLQEAGVIAAGYVDRPRSYYILSALHLASLKTITEESLEQTPYRFITDVDLFRSFLGPGERSAVFAFKDSASRQTDAYFFYLNVSQSSDPIMARVEIPGWVASDKNCVDILHAAIIRQCHLTGGYPYVLARAHELALISKSEREGLETMLAVALRREHIKPELSPKQAQKNLLVTE